jgi:hypothetical protein
MGVYAHQAGDTHSPIMPSAAASRIRNPVFFQELGHDKKDDGRGRTGDEDRREYFRIPYVIRFEHIQLYGRRDDERERQQKVPPAVFPGGFVRRKSL